MLSASRQHLEEIKNENFTTQNAIQDAKEFT
jgi:hypothetical protein